MLSPMGWVFVGIAVVVLVLWMMRRSANRRARGH